MPTAVDLNELYDASYRRLVVQIYAICGDLAEAEDAVQDAFVTALRKVPACSRQQPRGMGPHGGAQQGATWMAARLGDVATRPRCPVRRDRWTSAPTRRDRERWRRSTPSARGCGAALSGRPSGCRHRRPARGPGGHGEVATVSGPDRSPACWTQVTRERAAPCLSWTRSSYRRPDRAAAVPGAAERRAPSRRARVATTVAVAASVVAVTATTCTSVGPLIARSGAAAARAELTT
jgi:hypothetical protein